MFRSLFRRLQANHRRYAATQNRSRLAYRPAIEAFEDRLVLSSYRWASDVSGNWNDSSKWLDQSNNHGIPGAADDAVINPYGGGITVSIPSSVSVHSLQANDTIHLDGGTLSVANNSYISAELDMAAGTILNIAANAVFSSLGNYSTTSNLAGTINLGANASLSTAQLALSGTINAAAGSTVSLNGSTLINAGASLAGAGLYDLASNSSTLVLNSDASPQNFMINADDASVQGTGNLNVGTAGSGGQFTFADGTLAGTGRIIVPAGATFSVTSTSGHNLNRSLDCYGTIALAQHTTLTVASAATLTNEPGGVIALSHSGATLNTGGSGSLVENLGHILASTESGAGTVSLDCTLDNQGTIELQDTSTLDLGGPLTSTNGIFQADNTAGTIFLTYGSRSRLNGGTQFQGPGFTHFAGGDNGVLDIAGAVSVVNFQQDSGSITGNSNGLGSLTITGTYHWNKQLLGDGSYALPVTVASGATLNVANTDRVTIASVLDIQGTLNWSGTGTFAVGSTGDIENHGQFNITSDALLTDYYNFGWIAGVFNNYGTVTKTSPTGTGTTAITAPVFNNYGTVIVQNGALALNTGGTSNGLFEVASLGQIDFNNHTTTLTSGARFAGLGTAGTGLVDVNGGTLSVNAAVSIPNVELDSGVLTGTGLTVSKMLTWTGGMINTSGSPLSVVKTSGLTIAGNSATKYLDGATLKTSGRSHWQGSSNISVSNNGTINNTGTFTIENDQSLSGTGTFINSGLLSKTSGTAISTIGITLNNSGRVEVHSANLTISGSVTQISSGTLNSGTWSVFSTSHSPQPSVLNLSGSANLTTLASSATVKLSGPRSSFTNLSALATNNGSFQLLSGATFQTAGAFTNNGSLVLDPATSGSSLAVGGSFTQAPSGTLEIHLAGTSSNPTYGSISATGSITLGGSLVLGGSVHPAVGLAMNILQRSGSGSITGAFSNMTFAYNGMTFTVTISGSNVVLKRTA